MLPGQILHGQMNRHAVPWVAVRFLGVTFGSWFVPCDPVFAVRSGLCRVIYSLLYHRGCTFFIIKHRTCHSALHLLIIHAIMRYFYTIILFLLHTLIIVKALGSMHILRNQHFPNSWPPSPYKKSIFMHWRKWVTDCDLVLKINKLIHALEKTGHELWPGLKN